jgi:inorganic pyrophosphatase
MFIMSDLSKVPARNDENGDVNVIIDTPKGNRNKYKYDEDKKLFVLSGVLTLGHSFPFNFGFIPTTKAPDGDPIDVLVLMDEPTPAGCLVQTRLIGVIEAEQTEEGKTFRNDRLLGVAAVSKDYSDVRSVKDVNRQLIEEIQHFFISYNQARGKEFRPLGVHGPERAVQLLEQSLKRERSHAEEKKATNKKSA